MMPEFLVREGNLKLPVGSVERMDAMILDRRVGRYTAAGFLVCIAAWSMLRAGNPLIAGEAPPAKEPPGASTVLQEMALARDAFRGAVDVYVQIEDLKAGKPLLANVQALRVWQIGTETFVQFYDTGGEQWLVNARHIAAAQIGKPRAK